MKAYSRFQDGSKPGLTVGEQRLDRVVSSNGTYQKGKGWRPNQPHSFVKFKGTYKEVFDRSNPPNALSSRLITQGYVWDKGTHFRSWVIDSNKHLLRVQSVGTDLAELLATRKDTISMVSTRLMQIARGAQQIKRGQFGRAAKTFGIKKPGKLEKNNFSGNWLEYQYGWAPLVNDVYTLVVEEALREPPAVPITTVVRDSQQFAEWYLSGNYKEFSRRNVTTDITYRFKTLLRPNATVLSAASQSGLTNPALLAWNLMPYSFVVDWFYPVGDMLEALGSLHGIDIVSSTVSYRQRTLCEYTGYINDFSGMRANTLEIQKRRWNGLPAVQLPRFQNPLSLTHFANGMSLLTQVFKR